MRKGVSSECRHCYTLTLYNLCNLEKVFADLFSIL